MSVSEWSKHPNWDFFVVLGVGGWKWEGSTVK